MKFEGECRAVASALRRHAFIRWWHHLRCLRFGGPDLGARLVLIVFGVAALTAARTYSFIHSEPDGVEPHIPPLIWLFHQADMVFLPGVNHLRGLTPIAYIQCMALALALVCFYLAARAIVPAWLRRHYRPLAVASLGLAALLAVLNLQGVLPYSLALRTSHHYGNDAVSVTSCAVDDFLAARNPYSNFRVVKCLRSNFMDDGGIKTTPLQVGPFRHDRFYPSRDELRQQFSIAEARGEAYPPEFESYYSYPAVSFLAPAIFVALHIHDLSLFYLLCYLGIVALVVWKTRGGARLVALVAIVADAALWPTISGGATDGLYALLILVAWVFRDRRWLSAVLFGLAVASRQQAWFYLLFYAVLIARTEGRRELLWRLGIIGGIFALTNVPYLIAAPGDWLAGVLGPMRDPMFPRGTGLIALSINGQGSLPLGPRLLYTALELATLLGSLVLYWRTCRRHPGTGLVLAPMALFFAWRSLYSYFLPLSLLALYPALVEHNEPTEPIRLDLHDEQGVPTGSTVVAA